MYALFPPVCGWSSPRPTPCTAGAVAQHSTAQPGQFSPGGQQEAPWIAATSSNSSGEQQPCSPPSGSANTRCSLLREWIPWKTSKNGYAPFGCPPAAAAAPGAGILPRQITESILTVLIQTLKEAPINKQTRVSDVSFRSPSRINYFRSI